MKHFLKYSLLLVLLAWLAPTFSQAVTFPPGRAGSYTILKTPTDRYHSRWTFVYTPTEYRDSVDKYYPTIVFFHGKGAAGTDSSKLIKDQGLPNMISRGFNPEGVNPITKQLEKFIVICSQDPTGATWPKDQNAILKYLRTEMKLRVDTNAIFATGLSFGGAAAILFGTWDSAQARIPAAIVSASPMADINYKTNLNYLAAQHVPVWYWSSSYDSQRTGYAKAWTQKYIDAGGDAYTQVTNYNNGGSDPGHCCWDKLYSGVELYPGAYMKFPNTVAEHMNIYSFFLFFKKNQDVVAPPPPAGDTINYYIRSAKVITIQTTDGKTVIFQ